MGARRISRGARALKVDTRVSLYWAVSEAVTVGNGGLTVKGPVASAAHNQQAATSGGVFFQRRPALARHTQLQSGFPRLSAARKFLLRAITRFTGAPGAAGAEIVHSMQKLQRLQLFEELRSAHLASLSQ